VLRNRCAKHAAQLDAISMCKITRKYRCDFRRDLDAQNHSEISMQFSCANHARNLGAQNHAPIQCIVSTGGGGSALGNSNVSVSSPMAEGMGLRSNLLYLSSCGFIFVIRISSLSACDSTPQAWHMVMPSGESDIHRMPRWEQAMSGDDCATWETKWVMTFNVRERTTREFDPFPIRSLAECER
jgi:hypothetical protein